MAVLSKLSNSDRAEWEANGEQCSRCKTFGALKEALKRIRAFRDPTTTYYYYYYYYYKRVTWKK